MIKSLLDDEEPRDEKESRKSRLLKKRLRRKEELLSITLTEETASDESPAETEEEIRNGILGLSGPDPEPARDTVRERPPLLREDEGFHAPEPSGETGRAAELEKMLKELEDELRRERENESRRRSAHAVERARPGDPIRLGASSADLPPIPHRPNMRLKPDTDAEPESQVEVYRRAGLAWSAAIALFGSVVFMLAIGWVADVLLGSSPWGIVAGIVIGAVIGFLQFFRITSQILNRGSSDFEKVSLRGSGEESAPDPPNAPEETGPQAG